MTAAITFTLVGGPTVSFRYAGLHFLTDPTFDPPGTYGNLTKLAGPAVSLASIGSVDVVLLSHDEHDDNLDDAGRAMLRTARHVLTTPQGGERVDVAQGMSRWDAAIIPGPDADVTVTAVPARHGPSIVKQKIGQVTGFVLQAQGWPTVYISGDNSSVGKAARVADRFTDVDIAVLFAGAAKVERLGDVLLTIDAQRAGRIAALWPDAVIVPVHIDDWAHFSEPREVFLERFGASEAATRMVVLERGEPRTVGDAVAGQ